MENFARFKRYGIGSQTISEITGIPQTTIVRMQKNIKQKGDFTTVPTPYEVQKNIEEYEKKYGKIFGKKKYPSYNSNPNIPNIKKDIKKESVPVVAVEEKNNPVIENKKLDSSIFDDMPVDYLRDLANYLNSLADTKELKEKLF